MSQKLFDKYFPVDEDVEDANEREAARETREQLAGLIASPGYKFFWSKIELMIEEACDIKAGTEAQMLHQIGFKDALFALRSVMRTINGEIKAGRNDV